MIDSEKNRKHRKRVSVKESEKENTRQIMRSEKEILRYYFCYAKSI